METKNNHNFKGNCWYKPNGKHRNVAHDDICKLHDSPRGDCSECEKCTACEQEIGE